ncbi:TPA: Glu-tRNA(Gln) amidotransferase subunit GatD [Candidatus Woesearchaeota archaeon]|nr:Glu-tRNA(Gln) amidotransferase subunit GatD [Candidatus Woesearchaeota archaeon]HIH46792.1 Glu-tRNA(Gln) amidotransferase subunit GatD [Candidatus Woesearchaeota archaeon]HII88994.1 Glu-tRNA(Gln) amidotransferase subunit GatD [Candidatus Woesearchaeota archaeon]
MGESNKINKICERIRIVTDHETLEGIKLPSKEKGVIFIKLDSGYNVGVKEETIKRIDITGQLHPDAGDEGETGSSQDVKHNPKLPTIAILHTGGTIASKVDYRTGGVIARFAPEELLAMFPELSKICSITSRLLSNMFSEDMRFAHYKIMAHAIASEIQQGVKGIILTHGTDTLHYTAAALSFMLENLSVPVLLVGAQRSSDRGSSDAGSNLIAAAHFIAKTDFRGVAICMHKNPSDKQCVILPATKTRKMHTSRRDAFQAINTKPYAFVDYEKGTIEKLAPFPLPSEKKLAVREHFEETVGIITCHPNMFPEAFAYYRKENYKGLVIEGTGLGQAPVGVPNKECAIHNQILEEIRKLVESGCVVVMVSQCIYGRVHMHVYSNAIDLLKVGVIPAEDMTTETAFIKLAWLLGNYPVEQARKLFEQNLRGEISERTPYEEHFAPDFS